jgi:hypothetical protein
MRVAQQARLIGDAHRAEIGQHRVDQRDGRADIHVQATSQRQEARRRGILVIAGPDRFAKPQQASAGGSRVIPFIGKIIDLAAEGIELGGIGQDLARQQPSRETKTAAMPRQDAQRRGHCTVSATSKVSMTFAVVSTPGTPAPGCVPVPTR